MNRTMPLREMKKAKTKINLYRACMAFVDEKPYRHISVEELCAKAEISRATFFNFFPQKEDLLLYAMQVWIAARYIEICRQEKRGLAAIRHLLQKVHEEAQVSSFGMLGIISFLTETQTPPEGAKFTEIEEQLLFPEDAHLLPAPTQLTLASMFRQYIDEAKEDRQIADPLSTPDMVKIMFTIFYGGFLTAHLLQTKDIMSLYDMHMQRLLIVKQEGDQ